MQSFFNMALTEEDPRAALLIEEGAPKGVILGDAAIRGLDELLEFTTVASEVKELSEVAGRLGLGNVRILRTAANVSPLAVLSGYDFPSLEDCGITIFALSDFDARATDDARGMKHRFVWAASSFCAAYEPRWYQLTYYKAAAKQAGIAFSMPPSLVTVAATAMLEPWWQLPVSATERHVHILAERILDHVPNWDCLRDVLRDTNRWIMNYPAERDDFDLMLRRFNEDQPLAPWKMVR